MAWGAVAMALGSAALFGFAGIGRVGAPFGNDGRFLEIAGAMWLRRANPYDPAAFEAAARHLGFPEIGAVGFAYPPTAAPLAMLLGALPPGSNPAVLGALNCAAAVAVVLLLDRLAGLRRWDVKALAAIAVFGSPFAAHVFWMGQTTLLALAMLAAGWALGALGTNVVAAGAMLALSTLKPQLVFVPVVWLLLVERRWTVALAAGAFATLLAVPAAVASGGMLATAGDWCRALTRYAGGPVQGASFRHVFGVRSLIVVASGGGQGSAGRVPVAALVTVAMLAGALWLLWRARERAGTLGCLGLTLSLSLLFVYAHDYDLAALAPLLVFLWVRTEDSPAGSALLVIGVALIFLPQRWFRGAALHAGLPWVLHWREIVLLAMVCPTLVRLSMPAARAQALSRVPREDLRS